MNTIRHNRIGVTTQEDGSIDVVVPASMAEDFKLLVKRGTNTYPSMHVEIRDFADRLLRPDFQSPCMKTELYGYTSYEQQRAAELAANSNGIISTHWDIPAEDKYDIAVGKSLLKPAISTSNPLPPGCYCKAGQCAAPRPEWCRDASKRDAKKES